MLVAVGVVTMVAAGCIGQKSRNDDYVGPHSFRPDAREHTLGRADEGAI